MVTDKGINVVITGSTRGIGLGLAREYLRRGHSVMISGRSQRDCDEVASHLKSEFTSSRVLAQSCDVADIDSVGALWATSVAAFGQIHHWINNAGRNNWSGRLKKRPYASDTFRPES